MKTSNLTRQRLLDALEIINKFDYDKKTKVIYGCEKIGSALKDRKIMKKHNEKIMEIEKSFEEKLNDFKIDHCLTDEDNAVMREKVIVKDKNGNEREEHNGALKFDKQNQKLVDKRYEELKTEKEKKMQKFVEEEMEVPVHLLPLHVCLKDKQFRGLTITSKRALAGILVDAPHDEEFWDNYEDDKYENEPEKANGVGSKNEVTTEKAES